MTAWIHAENLYDSSGEYQGGVREPLEHAKLGAAILIARHGHV